MTATTGDGADLRSRAFAYHSVIADELMAYASNAQTFEVSYGDGAAGWAVYFAHMANAGLCEPAVAVRILNDATANVEYCKQMGLIDGILGIGYAASEVKDLLDLQDEDFRFDDDVVDLLSSAPRLLGCDLIAGITGAGAYALRFIEQPRANEIVDLCIEQLVETAVVARDGTSWDFAPTMKRMTDEVNYRKRLGAAHGNAGVVAFLAKALTLGARCNPTRELLQDSVAWLVAHQRAAEVVIPPVAPYGWCWGDLGIAAAFAWASRALGDSSLLEHAHQHVDRELRRPIHLTATPVDACICHGSAGVAQVYRRLGPLLGRRDIEDAVDRWISRTLAQRTEGGIGGYKFYQSDPQSGEGFWKSNPGLIAGSAGVGMVLLDYSIGLSPNWDAWLLLS